MSVTVKDKTKDFIKSIDSIRGKMVLVGINESDKTRDDDSPLDNAQLGYIHEFGEPAANIPARPWLVPGVDKVRATCAKILGRGMKESLDGNIQGLDDAMDTAGTVAVSSIKKYIQSKIAPPLAPATLRARAQKLLTHADKATREAAKHAIDKGDYTGIDTTPLIDTGNFLSNIKYTIKRAK